MSVILPYFPLICFHVRGNLKACAVWLDEILPFSSVNISAVLQK